MSSHSGNAKIILIALGANFGIAVAKFIGAFYSGSSSLLAEAIHSVVDCSNQILLLLGVKASEKPPTEKHPLGYGRESFFWSFVVSILLFSLGGLFALYEGIHKLSDDHAMDSPIIAIGILSLGIVLEGISFAACMKEVIARKKSKSLWKWYRQSTSAGLLVIFTEDLGALVGLMFALICVSISWYTGNPDWDAYGSIIIGGLLVCLAVVLSVEVKSLIIGEASNKDYRREVEGIVRDYMPGASVLNFIALQLGDNEVMMSVKIHPGSIDSLQVFIEATNKIESRIQERFPEVRWKFVEPDFKD